MNKLVSLDEFSLMTDNVSSSNNVVSSNVGDTDTNDVVKVGTFDDCNGVGDGVFNNVTKQKQKHKHKREFYQKRTDKKHFTSSFVVRV